MINEFSRTELLIGSEGMEKLRRSSVMVFGVGGVGSHCIEALARCGVGKLILVDNDTVSLTNINRQSVAFYSTVGCYKTEVMREKIRDISPETEVETYETFVLPENIDLFFGRDSEDEGNPDDGGNPENRGNPDYIIDAIDTVTAKLALAAKAKTLGIPMISCMGTGNKLHAELFEITDISKTSVCPLCKVMRRELKARGITSLKVLYSKEKPIDVSVNEPEDESEREDKGARRSIPGSISFVPPVAGLLIAGEAVRDLLGCGKAPA